MHDASVKKSKRAWQFFAIDTAEVQKAHLLDKCHIIVRYGSLDNGWEMTMIPQCIIGNIKAAHPDPDGEYVHFKANSNKPGLVDVNGRHGVLDEITVPSNVFHSDSPEYNQTKKKSKLFKYNNEQEAAAMTLVCFRTICLGFLIVLSHPTHQPSRRTAMTPRRHEAITLVIII
jgi:hypothetical protein